MQHTEIYPRLLNRNTETSSSSVGLLWVGEDPEVVIMACANTDMWTAASCIASTRESDWGWWQEVRRRIVPTPPVQLLGDGSQPRLQDLRSLHELWLGASPQSQHVKWSRSSSSCLHCDQMLDYDFPYDLKSRVRVIIDARMILDTSCILYICQF